MPDEIARLSEALAHDPAGMGWIPLADALRRARRLPAAERTALRGLERHPYQGDGHDVLARIAADGGDLGRARDEWEMALRLEPRHVGARLGLGWLAWRNGDQAGAQRWWQGAHDVAPNDPRVRAAGRQLQRAAGTGEASPSPQMTAAATTAATLTATAPSPAPSPGVAPAGARSILRPLTPSDEANEVQPAPAPPPARAAEPRRGGVKPAVTSSLPANAPVPLPANAPAPAEHPGDARSVFASIVRGGARFALLVDADGLVLAGATAVASGEDRSDLLAAELSGLSAEAQVALQQLQLGAWEHVLVEGDAATLALAPGGAATITLVATAAGTPAGLPRLLLDRARQRAEQWMASL
ncbi:MAG: roadblock/LC7 domain-containing protein [Gemmatimonadaceae bacterium]|nr:roadblock/LC7 domain-containing protein [Gemmatimonadaceae bacterium]